MKQAFLIIAHGNYQHLVRFIAKLKTNCNIYIHVDKKQKLNQIELENFKAISAVKGIYSQYTINWAGYNMLKCILFLLKEAYKDNQNEYFHLLSGQDYPIKPVSAFLSFMEENRGKEFLEYHTLPYADWGNGTYTRYQYFFLHDLFNYKTQRGRYWVSKALHYQRKWNLQRRLPDHFGTIYGGCCWFTLSRPCIKYILDYTESSPSFLNRLKYTFAPEETYFHSVVLNSPFRNKVINRSLRYVDWTYKNGNYPANLDINDFDVLQKSNAFFARKFISSLSDRLIEKIDNKLL
jgi:hypothetical protein